jgi:hypothetical protein
MVKIQLLEFLRTGIFGPICFGMNRAEVEQALGIPDLEGGISRKYPKPSIWRYGNIEISFESGVDRLCSIYIDHFEVPNSSKVIGVEPWIIQRGLSKSELESALTKQGIKYAELDNTYEGTISVIKTQAGVELYFLEKSEYIDEVLGLYSISLSPHIKSRLPVKQVSVTIPKLAYEKIRQLSQTQKRSIAKLCSEWIVSKVTELSECDRQRHVTVTPCISSNPFSVQIQQRLQTIEQEQSVSIFWACESGSRAWGFPSPDSDFDIRFLYIHRQEWYLSVDNKREVIEYPIEGELDINGWDIRKALRLLRKSHPVLIEWLHSPIVYQEKPTIVEKIRTLVPVYFSPAVCHYHYLHLAKKICQRYLQGDFINLKKIFYVLRPILACRWIEAGLGIVPLPFEALLAQLENTTLKVAITELLEQKKQELESSSAPVPVVITDFITHELARLSLLSYPKKFRTDSEILDQLFRQILVEI